MAGGRPKLAVIVTSFDSHQVLRRGLQSLSQQPDVGEIVVADCSPDDPEPLLGPEFPAVRFVHFAEPKVVPVLRWAALPLTAAPLVGALESRCVAAPDWARRIVEAHEAHPDCPAVGGPVAPGDSSSGFELGLYFCEYGAFTPPVAEGPAPALSGANLSYKRRDLEAERDYLESGRWETFLHERWLAQGRELRLCDARIAFHNTMAPATALRQRYHYGRGYAAERVEALPRPKAWLYAAFCPALPVLLTLRSGRTAAAKGLGWAFVRALPWTLLLNAAWSAGELVGYSRGPDRRARIF
ncbi:MAG: hypothetical protein GC160_17835 [Acidobacteria bacterium]|nr:hypothetical protein [Acidobacteriota bacterium]